MNENMSKIYSLLGLSMRAGKLVSGEYQCLEKIRCADASLIVVATDAGKNCKKKFANKSEFYGVELIEFGTKEENGKAIGKPPKSVMVISDEGFKNEIVDKYRNRGGM